jgi:hypothetical protein
MRLVLLVGAPAAKRLPAATATRFANPGPGPEDQRAERWLAPLHSAATALPATHAYCGEAWGQFTAALAVAPAGTACWVISPGVGLVPAGLPLPNDSAIWSRNFRRMNRARPSCKNGCGNCPGGYPNPGRAPKPRR